MLAALLVLLASPADGMLSQSTAPSRDGASPFTLSWSAGGANARGLGMTWSAEQGRFLPTVLLRRALLDDVSVGLRFRPVGGEEIGSEVDVDLLVRKEMGRFLVLGNAAVGKGIGPRADVDFEAAMFAGFTAAPQWRCGIEARYQREVVDDLHTDDDVGRAVDLTAGPSVAFVRGSLELRALAGWRAPRGTAAAGPAFVAGGGLDF
jgi:hypothetical protein